MLKDNVNTLDNSPKIAALNIVCCIHFVKDVRGSLISRKFVLTVNTGCAVSVCFVGYSNTNGI